jgi:hypothetical protein
MAIKVLTCLGYLTLTFLNVDVFILCLFVLFWFASLYFSRNETDVAHRLQYLRLEGFVFPLVVTYAPAYKTRFHGICFPVWYLDSCLFDASVVDTGGVLMIGVSYMLASFCFACLPIL